MFFVKCSNLGVLLARSCQDSTKSSHAAACFTIIMQLGHCSTGSLNILHKVANRKEDSEVVEQPNGKAQHG